MTIRSKPGNKNWYEGWAKMEAAAKDQINWWDEANVKDDIKCPYDKLPGHCDCYVQLSEDCHLCSNYPCIGISTQKREKTIGEIYDERHRGVNK